MLAQRRRRWANIKPTLIQCLVFADITAKLYLHVAANGATYHTLEQ